MEPRSRREADDHNVGARPPEGRQGPNKKDGLLYAGANGGSAGHGGLAMTQVGRLPGWRLDNSGQKIDLAARAG
jgi:hypothetical protein